MRRDGVAVGEGVEPGRERAAIGQGDAAVLDLPDLDALAVDEVLAHGHRVGLQEQPVTSGHFQLAGLAHVKGGGDTGRDEINFRAIGTADAQTVFHRGDHFHGVAPVEMFGLANEAQALAGHELAGVFLLRFRPRERIKNRDGFLLLTEDALCFERVAHLVGDGLNLGPRRRDQQRGLALPRGRQVGIGGTLIEPAVIRQCFGDGPKFEQLGKRLVGLFGSGQ